MSTWSCLSIGLTPFISTFDRTGKKVWKENMLWEVVFSALTPSLVWSKENKLSEPQNAVVVCTEPHLPNDHTVQYNGTRYMKVAGKGTIYVESDHPLGENLFLNWDTKFYTTGKARKTSFTAFYSLSRYTLK